MFHLLKTKHLRFTKNSRLKLSKKNETRIKMKIKVGKKSEYAQQRYNSTETVIKKANGCHLEIEM